MLRKIRIAMGHRDSIYRLEELIEIDDALIGGRQTGGKRAGFIAMQQVSGINREAVSQFVQRHLSPDQRVRSDALPSLAEIGKSQNHDARVTPLVP